MEHLWKTAFVAAVIGASALGFAGPAHADAEEHLQYEICTMLDEGRSVDTIGAAVMAAGYTERETVHLIHDAVMHKCIEHYKVIFPD